MTGIIIQARMGSSRLPGKVLMPLAGIPILKWVVKRCQRARVDKVIVATTTNREDDEILDETRLWGALCFRGSQDDVLERYVQCAKRYELDTIVRITADCPFVDPELIDQMLTKFQNLDYLYNTGGLRTFPRGLDVEIVRTKTLQKVHKMWLSAEDREHVTLCLTNHPQSCRSAQVVASEAYENRPPMRLTVDTQEDYTLACKLATEFWLQVSTKRILAYLRENPHLNKLNSQVEQTRTVMEFESDVQSVIEI